MAIAAGGTGGHIFPGLALADALKRRSPATAVSFIGTRKGLETSLIPRAGYELDLIDVVPLERRIGLGPLRAGVALVRSTFQAKTLVRERGVGIVVGMGGYPTLPAVAAARLARVPSVIHESGAVVGLANKIAARFTRNVAVAFEEAVAGFPARATPRVLGTPLATSLAGFDRDALRREARTTFDLPEDVVVLLVMGGSLGALKLNRVAIDLAARWRDRDDVRILLKAGRDHLEAATRELTVSGGARVAHPVAFLDRMDLAYAAADIALTRAGAGTVSELPAVGLPAVLIPYPHAPGDHQTLNAQPLVRAGAAVLVGDAEASVERVGPVVEELIEDRDRLERMAKAARNLARPHAADELAAWVLELSGRE